MTKVIELGDGTQLAVLYEDRSVLAIDKPAGWLLVPSHWDRTGRNLQRALESGINGREHWARSRNIRFLRFVHRLDAETSGVLLLVKSPGAVLAYSKLFESRDVDKAYLAVVPGIPAEQAWTCNLPLRPDPSRRERMLTDTGRPRQKGRDPHLESKEAETRFGVLKSKAGRALVLAQPITGRTHQIRVHLKASGYAVLGDPLYGGKVDESKIPPPMALRAVFLGYRDPFTRREVSIEAPWDRFLKNYRFELTRDELYQGLDRLRAGSSDEALPSQPKMPRTL